MKKKLNIAVLTVLLIFQTVLNPLGMFGVTFANAAAGAPIDPNDSNVTETITFSINGTPVSKGGSVNASVGSTVKYKVALKLAAGHKYSEGSTISYTLPAAFKGLGVGNPVLMHNGKVVGNVAMNGQTATLTFTEHITGVGGGLPTEAWFELSGTLQSTSGNWQESVQVPGFDTIELNFTPASKGNTITKKGKADNNAKNSQYITWTVDVNTDLKLTATSGTTEFTDTLTGAHTFDSVESIKELNVKPDGSVTEGNLVTLTPTYTSDKKTMTIHLPNKAHTGYHIVYKTKVGDPGNVAGADFTNSAKYNSKTASIPVKVTFGTPLKKTSSGPNDDLIADWTIQYNHNKRTIASGSAVLTDTWTAGHDLVGGTGGVKVYNEDGTNEIASNLYNVTATGLNDFTLTFAGQVTDAYTIKYKTKPNGIYPTNGLTNTNTVTRPDMTVTDGSNKASVSYSKERFVLDKTAKGVNYADKTMDWEIKANSKGNYTLKSGTTFTDTYNGSRLKVKGTPTVTVGGQPFTKFTFTPTGNPETGFTLVLNEDVSKEVIITYTTDYTIKDSGINTYTYSNTVDLSNTGVFSDTATDTDTQEIKHEQKANGKKTGNYNYGTKTFHWDVELNFNYNTITDAVFKDVLPATQKVTSITVNEGSLNAKGEFVPGTDKTISNTSGKANEIVLNLGNITGPYKVTYTSVDADGVYPHGKGKLSVTNTAELYAGGLTGTKNAEWDATVPVEHTEEILIKNGVQDGKTPKVNWNFQFNYAQSDLNNIVITDTVGKDADGSPLQLLLKDSFKVYEMEFSGTNSNPTRKEVTNPDLTVDTKNGTFTLKLPDGTKAYYVEYSSVFMGPSGSALENKVDVSYTSADGNAGSDEYSDANFTYDGGGNVSAIQFVILKTDASTGKPMSDAEFSLYGPYTGTALLAKDKTNADGYLDYGFKLAPSSSSSKKYKVVETTQTGYKPLTYEFELDPNKVETSGKYAGYQVIELSNIPTTLACDKLTLTAYDIDGNKLTSGEKITIQNIATEKAVEYTVGNNGQLIFKHSAGVNGNEPVLAAGTYDVTYADGTKTTIDVNHGNSPCEVEVKPAPACDKFTITIKKDATTPLASKNITLKDASDNDVATGTTDANGKVAFDSTKGNNPNGLQSGTYKVYEGKIYLGDVEVSYVVDCEEELVIAAPSCPTFTITLKDGDGKPRNGVTVIIKDASSNTVQSSTTFTTNSNGQVTVSNLPVGDYTLYEVNGGTETELKDFTVDTECKVEVQPAPACTDYTIQVLNENGEVIADGTEVTVKGVTDSSYEKTVEVTAGKVTIPSKDIPAGDYTITYGTKTTESFTVTHISDGTTDCATTVKEVKTPIDNATCPQFEITVKDDKGVLVGKTIELTHTDGTVISSLTTDSEGKVTIPSTSKAGTYYVSVTENGKTYNVGKVVVNYVDNCQAEVEPLKVCPIFTLTVKDVDKQPRKNVEVVIKDAAGTTVIAEGKTNKDGQVKVPYTLTDGTYDLYEKINGQETLLGTITVVDCEAEFIPTITVTVTFESCDKQPIANETFEWKDKDGNTFTTTTDQDGKVTVEDILQGEYTVTNKTTNVETTVKITSSTETITFCEENSCKIDKLIVPELKGQEVKITDGTTIETIKVADDGSIKELPFKSGTLKVTDLNGKELGTITFTGDCTGEFTYPACEDPTISLPNESGNELYILSEDIVGGVVTSPDATTLDLASITITSEDTVTVSVDGELTIDKESLDSTLEYYIVNKQGEILKIIKLDNDDLIVYTPTREEEARIEECEPKNPIPFEPTVPLTPLEPSTPTVPLTPLEPSTPPEKPVTPPTGGGGGGKPPVDPEKPVTPPVNPEKPVTPPVNPEKPVTPPVNPEKPVTPPVDPEKPVTPPVDPEKPVTPPVTPPVNEIIEKIPSLPGIQVVPPTNEGGTTTYRIPSVDELVKSLNGDRKKIEQSIKEIDAFLAMYNKLSPEEQAEIDKIVDVKGLKALRDRLQDELNVAAQGGSNVTDKTNTKGSSGDKQKLPQTDGEAQTAMMFAGLILVLASMYAFITRRRKQM